MMIISRSPCLTYYHMWLGLLRCWDFFRLKLEDDTLTHGCIRRQQVVKFRIRTDPKPSRSLAEPQGWLPGTLVNKVL